MARQIFRTNIYRLKSACASFLHVYILLCSDREKGEMGGEGGERGRVCGSYQSGSSLLARVG